MQGAEKIFALILARQLLKKPRIVLAVSIHSMIDVYILVLPHTSSWKEIFAMKEVCMCTYNKHVLVR